jgi:hypothetical protein
MTVTPRISSFIISGIIAGLVSTQLFEASLPVAPGEAGFFDLSVVRPPR